MNTTLGTLKRNYLWGLYAGFVGLAFYTHDGDIALMGSGPYAQGRVIAWTILFAFLFYSVYVSSRESFFKSLKQLHPYLWHRQIGLDLYIGLLFPVFLIYLIEGSIFAVLLWLVPILLFANLATLIYFVLNYDGIISYFM